MTLFQNRSKQRLRLKKRWKNCIFWQNFLFLIHFVTTSYHQKGKEHGLCSHLNPNFLLTDTISIIFWYAKVISKSFCYSMYIAIQKLMVLCFQFNFSGWKKWSLRSIKRPMIIKSSEIGRNFNISIRSWTISRNSSMTMIPSTLISPDSPVTLAATEVAAVAA